VKDFPATLVFYEAPHRIHRSLADCLEILGDRQASVARELTKLHETIVRGTISDIIGKLAGQTVKGEIVLVFDEVKLAPLRRETATKEKLKSRVKALVFEGLDRKAALKMAAKEYGLSKSEAYELTQIKSR